MSVPKRRIFSRGGAMAFGLLAAMASIAADKPPADPVVQARKLLHGGERDQAVRVLETAIETLTAKAKKEPDNADAAFQLSRVLAELQRDDEARKYADRAIRLDPKRPEYRMHRGRLLFYRNQPEAAMADMTKAADLAPDDPQYAIELGKLCYSLGKKTEAEAAMRRAIKIDPKSTDAITNLAYLLNDQKKYDQAGSLVEKLIAIDPGPKNRLVAGEVYKEQGKLDRAYQESLTAHKLDPKNARALGNLVLLAQMSGKLDERDRHRAALMKLHRQGTTKAPAFIRDEFRAGKCKVRVLEFYELKGNTPIKYLFEVSDEKGLPDYRISLGSYAMTNAVARETGMIKEGERMYHLDFYRERQHRTYGMFPKSPTYDDVKKRVITIIEGEGKPISGSTMPKPWFQDK